jgi:hypothetical protein
LKKGEIVVARSAFGPDEVDYYHILLENQRAGLIVYNLPVEDCIEENV